MAGKIEVVPEQKGSTINPEELAEEELPPERDYSVIWTNLPLPNWLFERLDSEKERIWEEEGVGHTEARQRARENIEKSLTDEEYRSILREIETRKAAKIMIRDSMMDEKSADQTPQVAEGGEGS